VDDNRLAAIETRDDRDLRAEDMRQMLTALRTAISRATTTNV